MDPDPYYKGMLSVVHNSNLDARHNKDLEAFFTNLEAVTETYPSVKVWNSRTCFCLFTLRTIHFPVCDGCEVTVKDGSRREASLPITITNSYCKPSKVFWAAAMTPMNVEISAKAPSNREEMRRFII